MREARAQRVIPHRRLRVRPGPSCCWGRGGVGRRGPGRARAKKGGRGRGRRPRSGAQEMEVRGTSSGGGNASPTEPTTASESPGFRQLVEVRFVGGWKNRSQGPRAKALSPPREKKEKKKKRRKKVKIFGKKVGIQNNSNLDENSKIFKKWREIQKVEI